MAEASYTVHRIGKSALLKLVVSHLDELEAARACKAVVQLALTYDGPAASGDGAARTWLTEQKTIQKKKMEQADHDLHTFRQEHDLVALSISDRLSLLRSRLTDLHKKKEATADVKRRRAIEKAIGSIKEDLLRLNLLEVQENRLDREAKIAEKMLRAIEKRLAAATVEPLLDRRLRLLDTCAPVACR